MVAFSPGLRRLVLLLAVPWADLLAVGGTMMLYDTPCSGLTTGDWRWWPPRTVCETELGRTETYGVTTSFLTFGVALHRDVLAHPCGARPIGPEVAEREGVLRGVPPHVQCHFVLPDGTVEHDGEFAGHLFFACHHRRAVVPRARRALRVLASRAWTS